MNAFHKIEGQSSVDSEHQWNETTSNDGVSIIFEELNKSDPDATLIDFTIGTLQDCAWTLDEATPDSKYKSCSLIACKLRETEIVKRILEARRPLEKEVLRAKCEDWIGNNPQWSYSKGDYNKNETLFILVGGLVWTEFKSCFNRHNLQKYEAHLRHFKGGDGRLDEKFKFEGFQWNHFLPLRIHSYLLIYLGLHNRNLHSPLDTVDDHQLMDLILEQLCLDIEMLKLKKIQKAIHKCYKDTPMEEELITLLANSVENQIRSQSRAYHIHSGFKGHTLYVRLEMEAAVGRGIIFNAGDLRSIHTASAKLDDKGNPKRYPFVFEFPINKGDDKKPITSYLTKLDQATKRTIAKEDPQKSADTDEVKRRIYLTRVKAIRVLNEEQDLNIYGAGSIQTVGNCVVANHNLLVHHTMKSQKLFLWLRDQELAIIRPCIPTGTGSSVATLSIDEREDDVLREIKNLHVIYEEGLRLEYEEFDWRNALQNYETASERGHISAQGKAGCFYFYGMGTKVDLQKGIKYLESAAEEDPFAQVILGIAYCTGIGVKPSDHTAVKYFQKSVEGGGDYARLYLACHLRAGRGIQCDPLQAENLLAGLESRLRNKAPKEVLALYWLGLMHQNGTGATQDLDAANHYYRQASERGFLPAKTKEMLQGLDVIPPKPIVFLDPKYEIYLTGLQEIAEQGYWESQYHLGVWLQKRREELLKRDLHEGIKSGYPSIDRNAVSSLQAAAKQGSAAAWYQLGILSLDQEKTKADKIWTVQCFNESAMRKYPEGIYQIGWCYLNRYPGLQNYNDGFQLLKEAAEMGSVNAMQYLSLLYKEGIFCIEDEKESRRYENMARKKTTTLCTSTTQLSLNEHENNIQLFIDETKEEKSDILFALAVQLYNGGRAKQERGKAIDLLEQASRKGKFYASRVLAEHYALEHNAAKCLEFLEKSAGQYQTMLAELGLPPKEFDPSQSDHFLMALDPTNRDIDITEQHGVGIKIEDPSETIVYLTRFYRIFDCKRNRPLSTWILKPANRIKKNIGIGTETTPELIPPPFSGIPHSRSDVNDKSRN